MKKSKSISRQIIVSGAILATAFGTSCSSDSDEVRNRYTNLSDCQKDYNNKDCEYVQGSYYGPYYNHNQSGSYLSGRTSVSGEHTLSKTATHVVNAAGAAILVGGAVSAMRASGGLKSFTKSGFGSTAHFSSSS